MNHENRSLLLFFDISSRCHGLVCNMIVAFPGHTHLFFSGDEADMYYDGNF